MIPPLEHWRKRREWRREAHERGVQHVLTPDAPDIPVPANVRIWHALLRDTERPERGR